MVALSFSTALSRVLRVLPPSASTPRVRRQSALSCEPGLQIRRTVVFAQTLSVRVRSIRRWRVGNLQTLLRGLCPPSPWDAWGNQRKLLRWRCFWRRMTPVLSRVSNDLYDKIKEDVAFRRKWAERCGFGFDLRSVVPNVPKSAEKKEAAQTA